MWKCESVKVSKSNTQFCIGGWILAVCVLAHCANAASFSAMSPDGKNEVRLETGGNGMEYSVWRSGKAIVEPTRFSIAVDVRGALNGVDAEPKAKTRKVEGTLPTPLYKKSSIDLAANETRVDFGDWAVAKLNCRPRFSVLANGRSRRSRTPPTRT